MNSKHMSHTSGMLLQTLIDCRGTFGKPGFQEGIHVYMALPERGSAICNRCSKRSDPPGRSGILEIWPRQESLGCWLYLSDTHVHLLSQHLLGFHGMGKGVTERTKTEIVF